MSIHMLKYLLAPLCRSLTYWHELVAWHQYSPSCFICLLWLWTAA